MAFRLKFLSRALRKIGEAQERYRMGNLSIRTAEATDIKEISALFDLYRQFYEQESNIELATDFIRNRMEKSESIILLAVDSNNEVLGFCQLYPTFCSVKASRIFVLSDLFVLPSKRKSGAGKALLVSAENLAKEAGVSRMDLTTARSNVSAQSLYESLDWEKDKVFIAYNKNMQA